MHVAVDCRYIRERPSGIGTYVEALVERLPRDAPSSHFLFWAYTPASHQLSNAQNVRQITVSPAPNSPLTILWPRLYASFEGLDLFHNPHNILPCGVRCPSIVTVHDVMSIDNPMLHRRSYDWLKRLYYPQAVWRALAHATRLIVPSAATAERILAWVPDAGPRIRVIPNAPHAEFVAPDDVEETRRRVAARLGIVTPYVLVVGENSQNKSHHIAIRAFREAVPPPWRLVLVQRLGRPDRLRKLANLLGIGDRVVWLTGVSREDVALLMQGATVLLQPSLYEGFGMPVVEAMACGCPVIASDIAALREVAGGAALMVPPGDTERFAGALRSVLTSPAHRHALKDAGLQRAGQFSWDRNARETLEVYEDAVGGVR